MRNVQLLLVNILFLSLTSSVFTKSFSQKQIRKPNIIYIYADDLGYGELGSYG